MNIEKDPSVKMLREFGLVSAAIVIALFAFFVPWLFDKTMPQWPWILAAVLVIWALIIPATLIYIYRPWLKFGAIMGFINTRILLGLVFYGLVTPTGWVIRIFGKNLLDKERINKQSYRVKSDSPDKKHMENPY